MMTTVSTTTTTRCVTNLGRVGCGAHRVGRHANTTTRMTTKMVTLSSSAPSLRGVAVVGRASGEESGSGGEDATKNDTLSNLDKLLGGAEFAPSEQGGADPRRGEEARAAKPRAVDAAAAEEASKVARDLAAAQERIRREKATQMQRNKNNSAPEEEYDFSERAIAALVYLLPLLDSLKYSKFLLLQFPLAGLALLPLKPIIELWFNLGFLQIIVFFATYLGVVQNQNMKRFVRFNAQQAVLLDILLIVPDLLTRTFQGIDGSGPTGGAGLQAEIIFFNSVFLFTYISCLVGSVSSTFGKETKLPLIGDAADMQQPR
jgi:uncharacterized membrane protein